MSEATTAAAVTENQTSLLDSVTPTDSKVVESNAGTGNVPAPTGNLLDSEPPKTAASGTDPDVDKTKGTEDPNKKPVEPVGAPEKYEDFKIAEGMKLEGATADELKSTAKELNLTQQQAQKLVDLHSKTVLNENKKAQEWYQNQVNTWKNETIEALGSNYKTELSLAKRTLDKYGTPELSKLLNNYGLSNNKEVINLFIKVGKHISEDNFAGGNNGVQEKKSPALVLYGNSK